MTLKKTLEIINDKIDRLIISGKKNSKEYKRLCKLHYNLIR